MLNLLSTMDELRRTTADFLIIDLRTALTFTDIAKTSADPETKRRNLKNAAQAYASVGELVKRAHLSDDDAQTVSSLHAELRDRLASLGMPVP